MNPIKVIILFVFCAISLASDSDDEGGVREKRVKSKNVVVPPGQHRLQVDYLSDLSNLDTKGKVLHRFGCTKESSLFQSSYCLWYSRKTTGSKSQGGTSFDQNLKLIATFASCEQFCK